MAYGNAGSVSSAYLDLLASTIDEWVEPNGLVLHATHSPLLALLYDASMQPGGDYMFQQLELGGGNDWRIPVIARAIQTSGAPAGVTRANMYNAITPAIQQDLTNIKWVKSTYQAQITDDYIRQTQNTGKQAMVDHLQLMYRQLRTDFFEATETDLFDNAAGASDKVQSVNDCLKNTGSVGGIDQSDTTNNTWWNAINEATAEVWNKPSWSKHVDQLTNDNPSPTGVKKGMSDVCFVYGDIYSLAREAAEQMQRSLEYKELGKTGYKYFEINGCRFFRTTKITADTYLLLKSWTWAWRYLQKFPEPVTPGFVPHPDRPGVWIRNYLWTISLGCYDVRQNGLGTNKTAA